MKVKRNNVEKLNEDEETQLMYCTRFGKPLQTTNKR